MKNKSIFLSLILILFLASFAEAQKKKKKDNQTKADTTSVQAPAAQPLETPELPVKSSVNPERMDVLMKVYALGFRYYDLSVSQMALYEMIAMDINNVALRDSLALLYYNMGKYGPAIAVASDVLSIEKNNLAMMEVRALSNESLQFYNDALNDYEKLYLLSPSPYILYKMATLQYATKKNEQCKTNIEILLSNNDLQKEKVQVPVNQMQEQEVSMKAAVLNLKGLLNKDLGNKEVAQKSFSEALKIAPDYKAAKANLDALNKTAAKK